MTLFRSMIFSFFLGLVWVVNAQAQPTLPNPVIFVTQVPAPGGFASIGSVFANHLTNIQAAPRGGDLWIRYPTGALRNLTQEAGYGMTGFQGAQAIAVRDPSVDATGTKVLFSMVVGAPAVQYEQGVWYWQIYEMTGFGIGQTPSIVRVATQPSDTNNVEPIYISNGDIVFSSDRPRDGRRHLYPQLDEYESTPTPTGLWRLNPLTGALTLMEHAPSGAFRPTLDSFGRIIFTRWDHLQRDQQAESPTYGAFNWASEEANAAILPALDVFPESRLDSANLSGHRFNHFFPWMINQDSTAEETLNHMGRHDVFSYFPRSFINDPSLTDFNPENPPRPNQNDAENWLQIREDPTHPGRYLAVNAPEFYTDASGQLIALYAPPDANPDTFQVEFLTPRSTRSFYDVPPPDFTGHYRNPLPLSDGRVVATYSAESRLNANDGTRANPISRYDFRLYRLQAGPGNTLEKEPGGALTAGLSKPLTYFDPDVLVSYSGPLWELSPVEVVAKSQPPITHHAPLAPPEQMAFTVAGVSELAFRSFLSDRGLGVFVSRNVTTRDRADRQQPFNLRVPNGVQTVGPLPGIVYDVPWMQVFQADQVRGLGNPIPRVGRRSLAQPFHDNASQAVMPSPLPESPEGSFKVFPDGSVAFIAPAARALTWQLTDAAGTPSVRERYWLNVAPGEIRSCPSCHGVNTADQAGQPVAQNTPQALIALLNHWRDTFGTDIIFQNGFD